MTKVGPSIRVLVTLAFLVVLVLIANPATADPGTGSALETVFTAESPPGGISPTCDWWELWC